ncbi:MAG: transcriptional regulator [Rhodospirillaceae bacterium]|nr:MAG: transcriptional regulator [Rhodospirillaceae bacterium]
MRPISALSHEARLSALRHLIQASQPVVAAGDIVRDLDVPASTMSTHFAILSRAGHVTSKHKGWVISHRVGTDGVRELLSFLASDCYRGKPKLCNDLMKAMASV